ncbi:MAG: (2Fe-2S)-binding protein [Alphaproteobacteria bacterium]|jgi:predicted molibdopterin-dependent oxidoreductase YjgC|nr:(2Fe-2S)-binding protein [Alphaproteobacteria bacterium]HJP21631.1 (2Fe-2S)-binding protein [Alphaproteobacteria bacterium]
MFKRLHDSSDLVTIAFEGESLRVPRNESVAAALLAAGAGHFGQASVSGEPRSAHCLIGVCFDCLVEIDGVANRQACLEPVREGMSVRRQSGPREVAS